MKTRALAILLPRNIDKLLVVKLGRYLDTVEDAVTENQTRLDLIERLKTHFVSSLDSTESVEVFEDYQSPALRVIATLKQIELAVNECEMNDYPTPTLVIWVLGLLDTAYRQMGLRGIPESEFNTLAKKARGNG